MSITRCPRCGMEQELGRAACTACGASMERRVLPFRALLATGDIVNGESGDRAMRLLIFAFIVVAAIAIIGLVVVWWWSYRAAENQPFAMAVPAMAHHATRVLAARF